MRHIKLRAVAEDIVEDIYPGQGNNAPNLLIVINKEDGQLSLCFVILHLPSNPTVNFTDKLWRDVGGLLLRLAGESVQGGEDYEANLTEEETAILSRSFRSADFDNDASLSETELSMAISRETKQHITVSRQSMQVSLVTRSVIVESNEE